MSLKNTIQRCFPFLFEKWGFEFVDLEDDFDGNIVVAQSETLRIGFAHDRADFFLDIGGMEEPDRLVGFYEIIDQLKAAGRIKAGYKHINQMKPVSRLLERNLPEIQAFFRDR